MAAVGLLDAAVRVLETGEPFERRNVPATGEHVLGRIVDVSIVRLSPGSVAMTFVDVTEQRAADDVLHRMASTDQLTGLLNRTSFRSGLELWIVEGSDVVVALLDLDGFKLVNDALGRAVGDQLLQRIAERLRDRLPDDWLLARLGGDEFAVAVRAPEHQSPAIGRLLADALVEPARIDGVDVVPQTSIGLASTQVDARDPSLLMRLADTALYSAKRQGLDVVVCGADERAAARARDRLFGSIDRAFAHEEFVPYVQPIVALAEDRLAGVEALARWVLPGHGVALPYEFLSLLAMTGRTADLTDLMLDRTRWIRAAGLDVSINIAPSDLHRPRLADLVATERSDRSDEGGRLILEVVEQDLGSAGESMIDELIGRGATMAIDDFGAAFSGLNRIVEHDIAIVKLDRSLVARIIDDPRRRRLISGVVDAVHDLGCAVVAEGIEDEATRIAVGDLGCDLGQGWALGGPAPMPLVAARLNGRSGSVATDWPTRAEIAHWELTAGTSSA